jgi:AcrR family transcriptional regulator
VQRAAAVSASQLYHYFTDKQALVHAVAEQQARTVLDKQQPLLGQLDSLASLARVARRSRSPRRAQAFRMANPMTATARDKTPGRHGLTSRTSRPPAAFRTRLRTGNALTLGGDLVLLAG